MKKTYSTEEKRKIQLELVRRFREEKYRYFEPSGKSDEFIELVGSGENFITLFSAANGIGKTVTGVNVVSHLCFSSENTFFEDLPIFKDFPFPKRGRIVSDPTNLEKNIIPTLKEWMPYGRYETSKGNKRFESIWKTDTDMEFDLMSYEQDPREFEGVTLGWAWFDEPPPEAILKATIARMRRGGIIFITATPLAGSAYLYDSFAKGQVEVEVVLPSGETTKYIRKVGYVEADIESACKTHGVRGHLDHSVIEAMIAEYSEDEKQARIYGKFQHLVGMVFKAFSRKIHVIRPFPIDKREFCVYEYLDPHPRNPDAVLWLAVDRQNQKFVVDELFYSPADIDDIAERIRSKSDHYRLMWRKADPSAFNVNQHDSDGKSLADRLASRGLYYQPASKYRTAADRRIGDALSYIEVKGNMVRAPEIYIFDTCPRTIWELEHYRWDEYVGKSADKHNKMEKPLDKDDHMVENLGRALLDEPTYRPQERRAREKGMDFNTYGAGVKNDDPFD